MSIGKMRFEWGTSANFTQLEDIKTLTRVSRQKELVLGNVLESCYNLYQRQQEDSEKRWVMVKNCLSAGGLRLG